MKASYYQPVLLILSDQPAIRIWIKQHLQDQFHIIEERKPNAAFQDARSARLKLIVIDDALEDYSSITLCKEFRKISPIGESAILIITGKLKKTFRDKALKAGATDFINDFLDAEELQTRVATSLKTLETHEKIAGLSSTLVSKKGPSHAILKNKFLLNDKALKLIEKAKKDKKGLITLLLEINDFKKLGEQVADEALLSISEQLKKMCPQQAIVSSSHEGKFLILLPEKTESSVQFLAEDIQKKIHSMSFGSKKITVSIAISPFQEKMGFDKLLQASQRALEKNKSQIISIHERNT